MREPQPSYSSPQHDWLESSSQARPRGHALTIGDQTYTYQQLNHLTDNLCAWLDKHISPNNGRVGVLMPNSLAYVCLVHGFARLGWVLIPLNTRLTADEIGWQLAHTECDHLLYSSEFVETVHVLQGLVPTLEAHLVPDPESLPEVVGRETRPWRLEQTQAILFTSGTTGKPKAVPLTFGNHFYSAMASAYRLGVVPHDLWLSCLPLYHVGGLAVIFRSCLYSTAVDLHPKFTLEGVNRSLDHKPITLASFVPTIMFRLLESRRKWPKTMRVALIGGAAASPELVTAAQAQSVPLATTYGLTEASSQVATLLPADVECKPASVGRPLLFTDVKIVDESEHICEPDQIGELWVKGPNVMSGYLNNPEANAARFRDGYFRTGDLGYIDADGDLWIVQRRSDLIVSGGENIYPAEIEQVLREHPAVNDACVVGLPDPEWGQKVAAMIELLPNKEAQLIDDQGLSQFASARLARYKLPRLMKFVPALPQTASGKIARKAVQAQLLLDDS